MSMLSAIDLNDETQFVTGEVSEIGADRRLAAKVRAPRRDATELPPQFSFGDRHVAAKLAGAGHAPVGFVRP
jgi:hypothetical protein